jgi:hypothetical protein
MAVFLLIDKHLSYARLLSVVLLGVAVTLWDVLPDNFKIAGNFYVVLFVAYYVVSLNGMRVIKKHLAYIVAASFLVSIIQIAGISEFVHLWNSQFLEENGGTYTQGIYISDITGRFDLDFDNIDSRQVRPSGIFHSSAILSWVYIAYIAYAISGFYKAKLHFYFVPWLIVFSGSKLVLLATILMLCVSYNKISFRIFIGMFVSAIASIIIHILLFGNLLETQFDYAFVYTSIDARLRIYFDLTLANALESVDYIQLASYFGEMIGAVLIVSWGIIYLKRLDYSYQYYVLGITLISAIIATPHFGNLMLGLFFIPAFFELKQSPHRAIERNLTPLPKAA